MRVFQRNIDFISHQDLTSQPRSATLVPGFLILSHVAGRKSRWDRAVEVVVTSPEGFHPPSPAPSGGTNPWP